MTSTRDRILDTAEICFAQRGFDGTSLREITGLADVNLGAVNYHFGSKQALIKEAEGGKCDKTIRITREWLKISTKTWAEC